MASFFSRITRYQPTSFADPRENRLTEITAATLERVPSLCFHFAKELLAARLPTWIVAETPTLVETQVHVENEGGRGFVDLVISFAAGSDEIARRFELHVEVKHGSPESGNQLDFYSSSLTQKNPWSGALVVLADRDFGNTAKLSDGTDVPVVHWQKLGETLRKLNLRATENAWLLREYLTYLEDERLMSAAPLDIEAAMFAALYPRANRSLVELHRIALEKVLEWGPLVQNWGGYAASSFGPERWHDFSTEAPANTPWDDDVVFEFQFLPDDESNTCRPSLAFFAGARFGKTASTPSDEWFSKMSDFGINRYPAGRELFAMAMKQPAELIGPKSIDEQGIEVGEWALGVFRTLRDNPPA